jgi:hypothetical protein
VSSFIAILVIDFFLGMLLINVFQMILGHRGGSLLM